MKPTIDPKAAPSALGRGLENDLKFGRENTPKRMPKGDPKWVLGGPGRVLGRQHFKFSGYFQKKFACPICSIYAKCVFVMALSLRDIEN